MKNKENAVCEYYEMIKKSWTFNRMTDAEKQRLDLLFCDAHRYVSGTYRMRWSQLHGMYFSFLIGIGYDSSCDWRGTDADAPQF